ncbi:MAG: urease accessory protein [Alphaproteobacteria bacterium]|jgi:urease accessory protein
MRDTPPDPIIPRPPFPSELLIWLSPSFPVGSFAYSQGLEAAVEQGWVTDQTTLRIWLIAVIQHGMLKNDLLLMSLVFRTANSAEIHSLAELSRAFQPSAERAKEALDQGQNFVVAYQSGWETQEASVGVFDEFESITFPIAVAMAAHEHDIDCAATLESYGTAFCSNSLSAAIRLGVIGQFDGQRVMADLLNEIRATTTIALTATLDDIGSATYGIDLASMLHETQTTRLFRS